MEGQLFVFRGSAAGPEAPALRMLEPVSMPGTAQRCNGWTLLVTGPRGSREPEVIQGAADSAEDCLGGISFDGFIGGRLASIANPAPTERMEFGRAIAATDLDADGLLDVIVGAQFGGASGRIYRFRGGWRGAASPTVLEHPPIPPGRSARGSFGATLAP